MKQLHKDTLTDNSAQIIAVSLDHKPTFQFIVGLNQNANLQTTNNFQEVALSHFNIDHLPRLIVASDSEGAQFASNTNKK